MAEPCARTNAGGEFRHGVQHLVHICHDVLAGDQNLRPSGRTQRHVKHGALFGNIDLVPAEHRVTVFRHPSFGGKPKQ